MGPGGPLCHLLICRHRKDGPTPNNIQGTLRVKGTKPRDPCEEGFNLIPSKTGFRRLKEAAQWKFEACVGFSLSTGHPDRVLCPLAC